MKKTAKLIKDGFKNILKGLGYSNDPRQNNFYTSNYQIDQQTASNLYTYNWLAAKVVDSPVDDATRKWINVLIPDAKKKKAIEDALKEFDVKSKVNQAMKWARVYGGSAIVILLDEDPELPLNMERIRPDSLFNLAVLDRYNIYPNVINRNLLSPNFGKPEFYVVSRNGQQIHHSRVIKFHGAISTLNEFEQRNYWGNSVFTKMWEPISDSQQTSNSIASLIYESNIDVYKIEGLNALVAEGNDEVVVKRLEILDKMKSVVNGVVLDKEDEYENKNKTFTTLPDIDDRFIQKVSGASNIPVTRLIGIHPAGLNATGDSDLYNYYDDVQSVQENDMRPKLNTIFEVIMRSSFSESETFEFDFNPLKQLSELEQADVNLKNAQRDQIYLDQNVIRPTDAMAELSENGVYVTIDENRVEEEQKEEEIALEAFAQEAEELNNMTPEEANELNPFTPSEENGEEEDDEESGSDQES